MSFDALLGNDRLKQNLAESLAKNRISHFYLISGPKGSGKNTLAKLLACAILCRGSRKPCGVCDACRKISTGNHPDVITVVDPDHKNVAVKIVRAFREDMFIRPNESDHKIYIFPQELGIEGQNALLKILEEPPKYGVFLLLTDNPEKMLPTVRSRCTELKMLALPEPVMRRELSSRFPQARQEDITAAIIRSGGFLGQALELLETGGAVPPQTQALVEALCSRSDLGLTEVLVPMERWKREELLEILSGWSALLEEALISRSGIQVISSQARLLSQSRTVSELYAALGNVKKAREYAMANVSAAAVCSWLYWQLRS